MKLLLENWREYLDEGQSKVYYWQTGGPWKGDAAIEFGVTHVPQSRPREQAGDLIEKVFEKIRKKSFPDRPSRFNCVFLCENIKGYEGRSYCNAREPNETYEVELRGDYNLFKTDSGNWTEVVDRYSRGEIGEDGMVRWAELYWKGTDNPLFGEILVSPPESAIIVGRYANR